MKPKQQSLQSITDAEFPFNLIYIIRILNFTLIHKIELDI